MARTKLGEICSFQSGGTPSRTNPDFFEGNIPWITTVALNGHIIGADAAIAWITDIAIKESAAKIVPAGSIMIGTRVGVGKVAINAVPMSTSQDIISMVLIDESCWNKEFLCRFIQSREAYLKSQARGATIKGIKIDVLASLDLPDVSMLEQQKTVSALNKIDRIIFARHAQLSALDDLIKARFVEMFGDPMTNAKGYELKKYGDVFELNAGGTPSKTHPEYWEGGTISWIGSNMCQDRYIYENDGKYITQEGYDNSSARLFPIDTVLVALVGATIGKTALLKFETTTNQNVLGIRGIREGGYLPEFVYYYTQGLYKKFIGISDGGFSMASKGFISELPIPVVPLALQEEFTSFADQVDKSKVVVQKALDEAQLLFDSLMQKKFG